MVTTYFSNPPVNILNNKVLFVSLYSVVRHRLATHMTPGFESRVVTKKSLLAVTDAVLRKAYKAHGPVVRWPRGRESPNVDLIVKPFFNTFFFFIHRVQLGKMDMAGTFI